MNCPSGSFIKAITIDGTTTCAPMQTTNCLEGQYAHKLVNGELQCKTIPKCNGNQNILRSHPTTGELVCVSLSCNTANQYFAGLDVNGNAICKNFPDRTCGPGQYIKEVKANGDINCDTVPNHLSLPKSDFSFVDGFDAGTNSWSRKDANQIAQQVCSKIVGFSWNGTQCIPAVSGSTDSYTKEEIDKLLALYPKMTDFHNVYSKPADLKIDPAILHGDYPRGGSYGNPIWAAQFKSHVVMTSTESINYIENCLAYNSGVHHTRRWAVIAIAWARRDSGSHDIVEFKIQQQAGSNPWTDTGGRMEVLLNADVWTPITIFHIAQVPANSSLSFRLAGKNIEGGNNWKVDRSQMLCFPVP